MAKPLLIYDGECRFCCRWIEAWKAITGERVRYATSQTVGSDYPEISPEEFSAAVQWIGSDGSRASGAQAVFLALATSVWYGRLALWTYLRIPGVRPLTEGAYQLVAGHRESFSLLTRWLWGSDVRPPQYGVSGGIFLRLLGAIYLVAFASYGFQVHGLFGPEGILPVHAAVETARSLPGSGGFWPSLFLWTGGSETMLLGACWLGGLAALLLIVGVTPAANLILLWGLYLSLAIVGQDFYQFQWDYLLLEIGFLAIFLAPWTWRLRGALRPPRLAHFLLIWLLFRLIFSSGVVKLASGDPAWTLGTALDFHYFTQPLPTPLAWYAQQLPAGFQWASVKIMFAIELGAPFLLFGPRRLRLAGAGAIAGLQVLIALTGNYGFFNWLTLALCLLAVDDHVWGRWSRPGSENIRGRFLPGWALGPLAAAIFFLSLVPLASAFRRPMAWAGSAPWRLLTEAYATIRPFRSLNGYGLFAVMTTERREIEVQGSDDGLTWKTYVFRFKPGAVDRAPRWVAPFMPRLDWQMWFAALGQADGNPWFISFLHRLLEGSPAVLPLLEENPFPDGPPKYIRALSDEYRFTAAAEAKKSGAWWVREPRAIYFPQASLRLP